MFCVGGPSTHTKHRRRMMIAMNGDYPTIVRSERSKLPTLRGLDHSFFPMVRSYTNGSPASINEHSQQLQGVVGECLSLFIRSGINSHSFI
ncbi:MAG: hypothetical protein EBZ48_16215 [Proteobacteria bacterium]|nr:hypothetical protein [Pseudomonadota bacterium]